MAVLVEQERAQESEGILGSIELVLSPQALVWPFTWVHCLPTGLGALELVKVSKPLFNAHQKSAI